MSRETNRVVDASGAADPKAAAPSRPLAGVVAASRRRLGRLAIREAIGRYAAHLCGAAAVCAATRPLLWPLEDGHVWKAVVRAVVLGGVGASVALAIVIVRAWRSRPSSLASARRLDASLGLAEIVASGFAFERDGRVDEMASFAVERARRAIVGIELESVLAPAARVRSRRESRWLVAAGAAAIVGLAVGAIDRLVVERAAHPVTGREETAAAELKKAAEAAANAPRELVGAKDPRADEMVDAARRASEAAQRGDRRRALDALDDMRKASRALEADERAQARALRSLRDELDGASAAARGAGEAGGAEGASRPARPSATASEAISALKKDLAAGRGDEASTRKMIERLERAEAAARAASESSAGKGGSKREDASGKGGSKSGDASGKDERAAAWSRVAAALAEAREATARGDAEAAKRAMDRAERELAALEKASREASGPAMARMAEGASELDRSLHAALRGDRSSGEGRDGSDGRAPGGRDGEGSGAARTASKSGEPSGAPGSGPGGSDRAPGPEQRRVKVDGALQARADVREGERAASVIEGMGRGGDPRAYREIFPSYDTVVEDGLREDTVPALRRPTVRRYFSSIRPGDDGDRKRP
ncbi:MAG: hypothetical protein KF764_20960 [Labilithrix sp.]|nr:hypothetical protein [Labilithrix sp.]